MSISEGNFEQPRKVIGYWLSEKKSQKLNWTDFSNVCRRYGYNLVKLNLDIPLEDQGPFHVILHKLTDIIVKALQNDEKAVRMMRHVEDYIERHEEVTVIDPLPNVKKLLDRSSPYRTIRDSHLNEFGIFTPAFVELTSEDSYVNLQRLKKAGVTFPFICKPSVSHGSSDCHKMAVIFSEAGLKDCKLPCVAQAFVNHNALLFKVYILGEQYYIVERPSLKNFYPCDHATIFFNSHDVSKSDSTSSLSILDPDEELHQEHIAADPDKVKLIVHTLTNVLGLSLFGVDIVVENNTGRHAIIDINSYPGYDGYPNFFEHLMKCVTKTVEDHEQMLSSKKHNSTSLSSPIVSSNSLKFITNNSSNSLKMTTNHHNGQITILGNGHVDEDEVNEGNDDILNSNKTINEHFSYKNSNLIAANKNNIDVSASDRDIEVADTNINASDSDKKMYLLEHQQQRVRTVTGSKKSVERQL